MTKQLQHGTQQAAYEMQARQYEIGRVKNEGDEARRTLAACLCVGSRREFVNIFSFTKN